MKNIKINWNRLKEARKEVWIIQIQLADRIWLSRQQMNNIETWYSETTDDTLKKIVKALNMPVMIKGKIFKPSYTYNYFLKK